MGMMAGAGMRRPPAESFGLKSLFAIEFIGACWFHILLFAFACALAARIAGVQVLRISFGSGKCLLRVGVFQVCAIPLTSYTKLKDTREPDPTMPGTHDAYNYKPRLVRVAILLSGPLSMLAAAFLFNP